MRGTFLALCALSLAVLAPAQSVSLSGPTQAFVFDLPSRSIRAVVGFPGSAMFGALIVSGVDLGSVAPHKNFGIVFQGGTCEFVAGLDTQANMTSLAGVAAQPDAIAWSGDGSTAILYSMTGNWMQIISGLPLNPAVGAYTDLSSLGGTLSAIGGDAKGLQIAVAVTGQNPGVYLYQISSQSFVPALSLASPVAVGFSADNTNLFAIDSSTGQLSVLALASFSPQTIALTGLANPVAVRGSEDPMNPQLVYIASGSDQIIREYDLTAQQVVSDTPLAVAPTRLDDFGLNSFLVAARAQATDPLWLLVTGPAAGIYFVPAAQTESGGTQ